ncbi:MAG TPA: polysaccharide deacetylase [Verrucomicrobiales bacterium]|nr:polysaccharide deacetylase [Verrucomicrobiales bacterium]HRJ07652.1 polysaccharide deacetylase family protein [Prosthecobacter sp.]HRK16731.1 polysaccharide deacetylase family protein [Prosthecobacter sp.]
MNDRAASVSIDLDNQWAYMKTQGCAGWEEFPSYLEKVAPRILETLRLCGLRATFFIVGKDAALEKNRAPLRAIADAGHEIANHSFLHEPWLHLYDDTELRRDFNQAEESIAAATGARPQGFRGPGFSTSPAVRALLRERGYVYDASILPTFIGGLARAYFFMTSKLPAEEKKRRSRLYGRFSDGFTPLRPYAIEPGLIEVPVTTLPLLRTPIHLSYLLFLGQYAMPLAHAYWHSAVAACRAAGVGPSLLLHPTDFLDADDVPAMRFFPAMRLPSARKIALVRLTLESLRAHWSTGTLLRHAQSLAGENTACLQKVQAC